MTFVSEPAEPIRKWFRDPIRVIVICHVLAVAICVCFSLSDRGLLFNTAVSDLIWDFGKWVGVPAVLSVWGFPIIMLSAVIFSRTTSSTKTLGVLVEIVLTFAHLFAIGPLVM